MMLKIGVYYLPEDGSDLRLAVNYANQALEYSGNNNDNEIKSSLDYSSLLICKTFLDVISEAMMDEDKINKLLINIVDQTLKMG